MATVTGLTAEKISELMDEQIIQAAIVGDNLILTTRGDVDIDVGVVVGPQGDEGPVGPAGPGADTLNELTDVDTAGAAAGKLLGFNGTNWVPVDNGSLGSVVELGFTPITSGTSGITSSITDITGLSVAITATARPHVVRVHLPNLIQNVAAGDVSVEIYDVTAGVVKTFTFLSVPSGKYAQIILEGRFTPGAGARTYKARAKTSAGNLDVAAAAGYPSFIQVIEV